MSDFTKSFVDYLQVLAQRDRGALAALRRSLGFDPGTYPAAFPVVERFVGSNTAREPLRQAMYLTAGLFAINSRQQLGRPFAMALAQVMQDRGSASIERRFIAVLSADVEGLPTHLRYAVQLLAAGEQALDFTWLLDDLSVLLDPWRLDERDRVRQRWARDFYRHVAAADADRVEAESAIESQAD